MAERDGLTEAIEQLQAAGFDVRESLIGWFSVGDALADLQEDIGDAYCWMHQPGGWTCWQCRDGHGEVC